MMLNATFSLTRLEMEFKSGFANIAYYVKSIVGEEFVIKTQNGEQKVFTSEGVESENPLLRDKLVSLINGLTITVGSTGICTQAEEVYTREAYGYDPSDLYPGE